VIFTDVGEVSVLASENLLVETNLWLKFCSAIHHCFSLSHISKVEFGLQQERVMCLFWTDYRILLLGQNYNFCY